MLKVSSRLFPIGYIIQVDAPNFNPNDFYIGGNWERIKGRVIVGVDEEQDEFNTTGKTGGSKTHTLSVNEMPSHNHNHDSYIQPPTTYQGGYDKVMVYGKPLGTPSVNWGTTFTGGGQAHNNLPPYQTAYVWKLISYSN